MKYPTHGIIFVISATIFLSWSPIPIASATKPSSDDVENGPKLRQSKPFTWQDQVTNATNRLGWKKQNSVDGMYPNGRFGSVVCLSTLGYAAISSPLGGDNGEGAVQVFTGQYDFYDPIAKPLQGENPGDGFGTAVALSATQSMIAVGAPDADSSTGRIYFYSARSHRFVDFLGFSAGVRAGDKLGSSMAMSSDGTRLLVGAPGSGYSNGYIQFYTYSSSFYRWDKVGKDYTNDQFQPGDGWGSSLAMSPEGDIVAVGIPNKDVVQVYTAYNGDIKKFGNDVYGVGLEGENFGHSISISEYGIHLMVGTATGDTVRIYLVIGGNYEQYGADIKGKDGFGFSLSTTANKKYLMIGSPKENLANLYYHGGGEFQKLGPSLYGAEDGDELGFSVSVASNGYNIAVGSPGANDGAGNVQFWRP